MSQTTDPALRSTYDRAFFAAQVEGSARSAAAMIPRIMDLVPRIASVVDLGCGTGVWLHHFKRAGVPRILGLDGGAADQGLLMLDHTEFRPVDFVQPLRLDDRFDLAMSLETAEHLPPSAAPTFVANLCRLSDVVIFGAALPGQGGTWHVNERWPSYWAALFEEQGYEVFDVLRPEVWYDQRVEWWYAQNTFLFVRSSREDLLPPLRELQAAQRRRALDVVHPRCFEAHRRALEGLRAWAEAQSHAAPPPPPPSAPLAAEPPSVLPADPSLAAEMRAAEAEERLRAIELSTSWRITGVFRRLAAPYPAARAALRRVLSPAWRAGRAMYHAAGRSRRA
jgi:SAM-dependent methyltransferase